MYSEQSPAALNLCHKNITLFHSESHKRLELLYIKLRLQAQEAFEPHIQTIPWKSSLMV